MIALECLMNKRNRGYWLAKTTQTALCSRDGMTTFSGKTGISIQPLPLSLPPTMTGTNDQ